MAVANSFRVMILLLAVSMTLVSCAKKDSEFKGRKSASGALYAGDPAKNAAADQAAAAMGVEADILSIASPVSIGQGSIAINSIVSINKSEYDITTRHSYVNQEERTAPADIGGIQLVASGMCANVNCSPYYMMLTFVRGNQPVKQIAYKKFFDYAGEGTQSDYIATRAPNQFFRDLQEARQVLDSGVVETQE